jgi:chromosome segregation ATPase
MFLSNPVDSASTQTTTKAAAPATPGQVRQQVVALNQELEEAASKFERLQEPLATQQHLLQLLKQGQAHLQNLRKQNDALRQQVELTTTDRDRLAARLVDVEREVGRATVERDQRSRELEQREAAHQQFARERSEERSTFERLLAEARSNEREMVQELDEQREQNNILREAAMRAQSLARQIMNTHAPVTPKELDEWLKDQGIG